MTNKIIALVDCNNFYCSCERVFRPSLNNRPVGVLSNNDGCFVARSDEVKALGIAMGAPLFQVRDIVHKHNVVICSANFALYGDMSNRVMMLLKEFCPNLEIYSIDEAFLDLSDIPSDEVEARCLELTRWVEQCTGIPISVGIGRSKTQAKLANAVAKKRLKQPVFRIDRLEDVQNLYQRFNVGEVWGIGRRYAARMNEIGITTVHDLIHYPQDLLQRLFNVVVVRSALELKGYPVLALEHVRKPKQSILCSRSFGVLQTEHGALMSAIAAHTANAATKMRAQGSLTQEITIFVRTNPFDSRPNYTAKQTYRFATPTQDTVALLHAAEMALAEIYEPGFHYKKAGVLLTHLTEAPNDDAFSASDLPKRVQLMGAVDKINQKFGKRTLQYAAEVDMYRWQMQREHVSAPYTTDFNHLVKVS